jgi:flagellar L-ring protein precursor FlgH
MKNKTRMGKMKTYNKQILSLVIALGLSTGLTACSSLDRLANVGQAPTMSRIENPQLRPNYQPVSMPMPAPAVEQAKPNSLWSSSRKNFFKDQRASEVGDILTVVVDIQDEATLENETSRSRSSNEGANMNNFLGYEGSLGRILPEAVSPSSLVGLTGSSNHTGTGDTEREEEIITRVAAVITQVLPNGNLVISGSQEVLVNFEKRILKVDGIIRPEDVSVDNTINHEQIAEARIIYGGEGQLTDVQQPRYGQQIYDILFPF